MHGFCARPGLHSHTVLAAGFELVEVAAAAVGTLRTPTSRAMVATAPLNLWVTPALIGFLSRCSAAEVSQTAVQVTVAGGVRRSRHAEQQSHRAAGS